MTKRRSHDKQTSDTFSLHHSISSFISHATNVVDREFYNTIMLVITISTTHYIYIYILRSILVCYIVIYYLNYMAIYQDIQFFIFNKHLLELTTTKKDLLKEVTYHEEVYTIISLLIYRCNGIF